MTCDYAALEHRPHLLYRWYDTDRRLLYVGITAAPKARYKLHKQWWAWKYVALVELERIDGRSTAQAAERHVIETERPAYNVAHTPLHAIRTRGPLHCVATEFAPLLGARRVARPPTVVMRDTGEVTTFAAALGVTAGRVQQLAKP